jgi:hypothetical protein
MVAAFATYDGILDRISRNIVDSVAPVDTVKSEHKAAPKSTKTATKATFGGMRKGFLN